ncbi:MAG: NERD domain-containing protein [Clostridia bacterium]|nr:NERD domain-containing protein [Clostridia bacterium]
MEIKTELLFWSMMFFFFLFLIRICHVLVLKLKDREKQSERKTKEDSIVIGKKGETEVFRVLEKTHSSHKKIINDIVVKTANDEMSQIDHILINEAGIFVIETKNYKGAIYGSDAGLHWTQYLNGKKFKFYNPVKQNASHTKRLKKILGDIYPYYSVIVFVKNNTRKINIDNVINLEDLAHYIDAHHDKKLSRDEITCIYKRLRKMKKKKYKHKLWEGGQAA